MDDFTDNENSTFPLLRPVHCDLTFASESLTLKEFSEGYVNLLPLLVHIKEGYCSCNEKDFTLSSGEIYRLTDVLKQRRVVLKDESGQLLSFPADHSLQFTVSQKGQTLKVAREAKSLEEILRSSFYKLQPTQTYVSPVHDAGKGEEEIVFWSGADENMAMEMNNLKIVEAYDEKYLVGNGILYEEASLTPTIFPLWLPAKIEIINGFQGEPSRNFQEFLEHLDLVLQDTKNYTTAGNKEIMLFEAGCDEQETYADIRQSHYVSIGQVKRETHSYEMVNLSGPQQNPEATNEANGERKRRPPAPSPGSSSSKVTSNSFKSREVLKDIKDAFSKIPKPRKLTSHFKTRNNLGQTSNLSAHPAEDTESTTYQRMVKQMQTPHTYEVIRAGNPPDLPPRPKTEARVGRKPAAPPHVEEESNVPTTISQRAGSPNNHRPQVLTDNTGFMVLSSVPQKLPEARSKSFQQNQNKTGGAAAHVAVTKRHSTIVSSMVDHLERHTEKDSSSEERNEQLRRAGSLASAECDAQSSSESRIQHRTGQDTVQESAGVEPFRTKLQASYRVGEILERTQSQSSKHDHVTSSPQKPMPVKSRISTTKIYEEDILPTTTYPKTAPTVLKSNPATEAATATKHAILSYQKPRETLGYKSGSVKEPMYSSHKDVQIPVRLMSVHEVCETLRLLKMEKYVPKFKDNDVDGAMLVDLDVDILMEDFELSSFEAKKLMKFADGWRLKTGI